MTTWIILRAAGIGAYLLLFLSVAWGVIGTMSLFGARVAKSTAITMHQFLSTAALLLLSVHVGGLLLDAYMPFHPLDVLVPLHARFRSAAVAFGIVAMYAMVIVLASSWTRRQLGPVWWRRLHLLAVPAFALSMVHGVFAGTDTTRPWMWWLYVATGLSVVFLVVVRGLTAGVRPERHTAPDGVRARPLAPPRAVAEDVVSERAS
jgi:methionine sulfoxide reductase heme-binding subunit